ncbi:MAG: type II toxin-antitoxin system RelE/ParE family toxin, partial [Collinsella sp.]|nr:type II toxin-antitoxin system RelE/ParE family toxin [Collinsella sp.]
VEAGILEHLKNPTMPPTYPSTRRRLHPYYRFYVGSYMVFYVVIDDVMEVRRLLYKSRDIESSIR